MLNKRNFSSFAIWGILIITLNLPISAAPSWGELFEVKQPDGKLVQVSVWGDEFYRRVESLDGYTLVRNSGGWICYATLARDGEALVPTDLIYGRDDLNNSERISGLTKHLDLKPETVMSIVRQRRIELLGDATGKTYLDEAPRQVIGAIKGLTILMDFPDDTATIPPDSINAFMNRVGFNGSGNNGSIFDYFKEVSSGKLDYTNMITVYYRAKNSKLYYDDSVNGKPRELLTEALTGLKDQYDFSLLSVNSSKRVLAVNALYAGRCNSPWAKGLWPHSGGLSPVFTDDGVTISRYQMTSLGSGLSIGTTIHENGHMTCGFPDLYDYGKDSKGVGSFCIMCSGGGKNPMVPCAYLRSKAGWETPQDITSATVGSLFTHVANSYSSFVFKNAGNVNEFFYVESRRKLGRNTNIPDTGLIIWHVDTKGSNDNQEMTPEKHYLVSVEQADGLFEFEKNLTGQKDGDCFHAGYKTSFNDNTTPNSKWWNGTASGFQVGNISAVGPQMSFTIGDVSGIQSNQMNNNPFIGLTVSPKIVRSYGPVTFTYTGTKEASAVTLSVYTMSGKCVYSRLLNNGGNARNSSEWNLTNNSGNPVSAGSYYAVMRIAGNDERVMRTEQVKFHIVR